MEYRYLAFWSGAEPGDDDHARALVERMREREDEEDPSPLLLSFVADITERYPDLMSLPDEMVDQSVWVSRTRALVRVSEGAGSRADPAMARG